MAATEKFIKTVLIVNQWVRLVRRAIMRLVVLDTLDALANVAAHERIRT